MKKLRERLEQASVHRQYRYDDAAERAGRSAESAMQVDLDARLEGTGWQLYCGLRVPDPLHRRRREVDFVLATPDELILVELKNWSGRLELEDRNFIQERRHNAGSIDHGPVLEELYEKRRVLEAYHRRKRRPAAPVRCMLVFYNRRLRVPAVLRDREDVLFYGDFRGELPERDADPQSVFEALLQLLGLREAPPGRVPTVVGDYAETLGELGSWDTLRFAGGQNKAGDLRTSDRPLIVDGVALTDRKKVQQIDFSVGRSALMAVFRAPPRDATVRFRDGTSRSVSFPASATIRFQAAGAKRAEELHLYELERLRYGYTLRPELRVDWAELRVGDQFTGIVKSIKPFGVFVHFGGPRDGLLHISKYTPQELADLRPGDWLELQIVGLNKREERIALDLAGRR